MSRAATAAARREVDAQVGLIVFLGATAMLFAALLLAYAVVRAEAPRWPPAGTPPFPRAAAGANTLLLIGASLALRRARRARDRARRWTRAALALGTAFLLAQAALWRHLIAARLGPGAGALGEVYFALSALHALHVAGGLVALGLARARRGLPAGTLGGFPLPPATDSAGRSPAPSTRLRLVTIYWDFVLAIWVVAYVAVCWL